MEECLPHLFQCGDGECLDPVLVCNSFPNCGDGSDEGESCQIKCTDVDNDRCSQTCFSTPQGMVRIHEFALGVLEVHLVSLLL